MKRGGAPVAQEGAEALHGLAGAEALHGLTGAETVWRVQRPTCNAHSWNIIANQCNLEALKAASARYNIRAAVA